VPSEALSDLIEALASALKIPVKADA